MTGPTGPGSRPGSDAAAWRLRARVRLRDLRVALNAPLINRSWGFAALGASLLPLSLEKRLGLRLRAMQRLEGRFGRAMIRRSLRRWLSDARSAVWREKRIGWNRYPGVGATGAHERSLATSLVLKAPGPDGEKGVLYSSIESNWMKIVANHDARAFFRDYLLVGASTWSPTDYAVFASLRGLSDDPAFLGISNPSDLAAYGLFAPGIRPVPIMACDWCDPDFFRPRPRTARDVDILMVAHFAPVKRHWLLFQALRRMRRDLRVVVIGRPGSGGGEEEIRAQARAFGVRQDLLVLSRLEIEEVMRYQCRSKISVLCSKREGSCVAVTESMFADTPVVMMKDCHVGSRAYINAQTGRLSSRKDLHLTLSEMLERAETISPRAWAIEHISAQASSGRLNGILRDYCLDAGRPWRRDIAPLCWRYVPSYLDARDRERLRPQIEIIRDRYGILLQEFVDERTQLLPGERPQPAAAAEERPGISVT